MHKNSKKAQKVTKKQKKKSFFPGVYFFVIRKDITFFIFYVYMFFTRNPVSIHEIT
jgi:hypothetical protein